MNKAPYQAPKVLQLRLETKVAEDAMKWWKVEEYFNARKLYGISGSELVGFIVKLMKEG